MNSITKFLALALGSFTLALPLAAQEAKHYHYQNGQRVELVLDTNRSVSFAGQPELRAHSAKSAKDLAASGDSPVLVDPRNNQVRALPGGVVVTLADGIDSAAAKAQLAALNLQIKYAIAEPRVWLVESPIGLESLALANRLQESGKVHAAEPNWWRQRKTK